MAVGSKDPPVRQKSGRRWLGAGFLAILLIGGCSAGGSHAGAPQGTPASTGVPDGTAAPAPAGKPKPEKKAQDDPNPKAGEASARERIIEISMRERVLSDYTALLVLESDEDYAHFHLDRKALSDILFIDPKTWKIDLGNVRGHDPIAPADLSSQLLHLEASQRKDAPLSLTSSEGVGLQLKRLGAATVVQGPLAFTELHLSFANPQDRTLEGRFELALPSGAAISRLAMYNQDKWVEGEVVELQAAREAYEDALHRRQDPALMEKQAGNRFQARIFPIPAKGRKDLIVSYSQELTSGQDYRLPLAGLPEIEQLEITALVSEDPSREPYRLRMKDENKKPLGDFVLARRSPVKGLVAQDLALVSVGPSLQNRSEDDLQRMTILIDSSASSAGVYSAQIAALELLLRDLPKELPLTIACFDQRVEPMFQGKNRDFSAKKLLARAPLGATDLSAALEWAGRQSGHDRLLLVSDGLATLGPKSYEAGSDWKRIDVLSLAGAQDREGLEDLAFRHHGLVLDPERRLRDQVNDAALGVDVKIAGADWVWPERLDGLQVGQERLIYARVPGLKQQLEVQLGAEKQRIDLFSVAPPLLRRAAARAEIARLSQSQAKTVRKSEKADRTPAKAVNWRGAPLPSPSGSSHAYSDKMLEVEKQLQGGHYQEALRLSSDWHSEQPADVLALVALGQTLEALQRPEEAARAYGSLIDLYPSRADLRRYAGCMLQSLQPGQAVALDSFRQALEQRPDHPSSHRLFAYALARLGRYAEAYEVLEGALKRTFPEGRFAGYRRILEEDQGLIGAAWAAREPSRRAELKAHCKAWPTGMSTRFVLSWETDANDVDFHIHDGKGGHAFYENKELVSGGALYDDVTTGYGPECFTIPGPPTAFPYKLQIHYYSRGPMGYGMGNLEIVQHDGNGHLSFEERPYVVMNDQAFVDLGSFEKPLESR